MVFIDMPRREVTLKLVYYGPALSGKTTNLQQLHRLMQGHTDGQLVTLNTRDDRTLFFDLLPLRLSVRGGLSLRVKLFTVPGQVIHNTTRKIVLQGADGVAFVADSRISQTRANNESFANLRANLNDNGIAMSDIGVVIQLNKRDLPGIRSDEEVARIRAKGSEPVFTAIALQGHGVPQTFLGLASASWRKLDRRYGFEERFGVSHDEVLGELRRALGGG
ncbi:MAG: gliding motility protein [Myxococcales bacterium]|nr:gliding motility protein [Myxococcales bacterium]